MLASSDIHRPLTGIRILLQSPHCAPLPHISLSSGEEQTGMTPVTLCVWKPCERRSSSPTFSLVFLLSTVSRALDNGGIFRFGMIFLICVNPSLGLSQKFQILSGMLLWHPTRDITLSMWCPYFCDTISSFAYILIGQSESEYISFVLKPDIVECTSSFCMSSYLCSFQIIRTVWTK